MTKALFTRTISGLQPADDGAREALAGIPLGTIVACEVTRPRNLKHHRLYWGLCQAIANAIGAKADNISDLIKLRTGHFVTVESKSGTHHFPRSISFAKLDQAGFSAFFEDACEVVCREFLPHMAATALRLEIEQMVGLPVNQEAA